MKHDILMVFLDDQFVFGLTNHAGTHPEGVFPEFEWFWKLHSQIIWIGKTLIGEYGVC